LEEINTGVCKKIITVGNFGLYKLKIYIEVGFPGRAE
jgi:hypothetical protein